MRAFRSPSPGGDLDDSIQEVTTHVDRTRVFPSRKRCTNFPPLLRLFGSLDRGIATRWLPMKNRDAIRLNDGDEMPRQASRVLLLKSLGLICAFCCATATFAQNRYQITRIPTPQGANSAALGINNKGEIVGYSFQGEDYQAFLYSPSDQSVT